MSDVYILGVGLHPFGRFPEKSIEDLAAVAIQESLRDAALDFTQIEAAYCANAFEGIGVGVRCVTQMGETGLPITNIEQACASGSSALIQASTAIAAGIYDIVLVLGYEKMGRGPLLTASAESFSQRMGLDVVPGTYALKAQRYMSAYGVGPEIFAEVSVKAHKSGSLNPNAQYQTICTREEVLASRVVVDPITLLQCCPTSDGASAVILASNKKVQQLGQSRAVKLQAWANGSGKATADSFGGAETESEFTRLAKILYERAGVGPGDVDVAQVNDACTPGEIFAIENLGLVPEGEGANAVVAGRTSIGGDIPVNTDGGLLSRGHPLGATGGAMATELFRQLNGEAGARQVAKTPQVGILHNHGLGGANLMLLTK